MTHASLTKRAVALLIDMLICLAWLALPIACGIWLYQDFGIALPNLLPLFLFVCIPFYFILLPYKTGQTLGLKVMGIKIISSSGGKMKLWQALVRYLVSIIFSSGLLFLGFIWVLFDKKKRTWHDLFAKTEVFNVKENSAEQTMKVKRGISKTIISILLFSLLIPPVYSDDFNIIDWCTSGTHLLKESGIVSSSNETVTISYEIWVDDLVNSPAKSVKAFFLRSKGTNDTKVVMLEAKKDGKKFTYNIPKEALAEALWNNDTCFFTAVKLENSQKPEANHYDFYLVLNGVEKTSLLDSKDYIIESLSQILLGNYSENVTVLGTGIVISAGLTGVDLPMDVRDLSYDLYRWEWSWSHAGNTLLDGVGLVPIVGVAKNLDEIGSLIKAGKVIKKTNDAYDIAKNGGKHAGFFKGYIKRSKAEIKKGIDSLEKQINKHIEKINNPQKYADNWENMPQIEKDGLISKWEKDINRQLEQKDILEGILKSKD